MPSLRRQFLYFVTFSSFFGFAKLADAAGDAGRGEKLIASCTACHSQDGNSPAPTFPKIAGLGEKYLYKQLKDIKAGNAGEAGKRPVPEMTGLLKNNSDQDLQDMAAYFDSKKLQLSGSAKQEVLLNSGEVTDSLALGKQMYRAGNLETGVPACTACHAPSGMGNAPAGYARLGGQYAEYITKQLKNFRAGKRVNDENMVMRGAARMMSDAEIEAVANYIAGLN